MEFHKQYYSNGCVTSHCPLLPLVLYTLQGMLSLSRVLARGCSSKKNLIVNFASHCIGCVIETTTSWRATFHSSYRPLPHYAIHGSHYIVIFIITSNYSLRSKQMNKRTYQDCNQMLLQQECKLINKPQFLVHIIYMRDLKTRCVLQKHSSPTYFSSFHPQCMNFIGLINWWL